MFSKLLVLMFGFNCIVCIDLNDYEPTDYDWEGMYAGENWKLFTCLNIGMFVLSLIILAGIIAVFIKIKKKKSKPSSSSSMVTNLHYNVGSSKSKSTKGNDKPSRFTMNFYQMTTKPAKSPVQISDNVYEEIPHATKKAEDEEEDYDHLNFNRESQQNDSYFKQFMNRTFNE